MTTSQQMNTILIRIQDTEGLSNIEQFITSTKCVQRSCALIAELLGTIKIYLEWFFVESSPEGRRTAECA